MLRAPCLSPKKRAELVRLARDIPRYPGVPEKQKELLAEFNGISSLQLELWQFNGAVFWPKETSTFVECALSYVEVPKPPSTSDAARWVLELRCRAASMADMHHTLRALEQLSEHPEDVARLVFFTEIPPQKVLDAMVNRDRDLGRAFLGKGEAKIALGDVDDDELASVVAVADEGIDCSDRGDRDGLAAAARALSKRTGQEVTEQELRALPGAMNTEPWARGLLLARDLLTRKALAWSEARHVVARYFASIHALDDPSTMAFESLLDAVTPYPHIRIHHEMSEGSDEKLEETLHEVTRHVHPWGDAPPAPPPVTVEDAWVAARAWASARESKEWAAAVSCKTALQQALDQVEVPELRELLSLHDANRRARMVSLGLVSKEQPDLEGTQPTPPVVEPSSPERVKHSKFGIGEVVARLGQGENAVVEVRFADAVRKLLARFVSPAK